jgi:hypothetical protein
VAVHYQTLVAVAHLIRVATAVVVVERQVAVVVAVLFVLM